jgi:hypothetical protein
MAMKGTIPTFNASGNVSQQEPPKEKIVIIRGSWNTQGKSWKQDHLDAESKSGLHYSGDLQSRFMEFTRTHEIIDVQPVHQSVGHEIVLMVRYKP